MNLAGLNEAAIVVALVTAIAALTVIVIVSGADSVAATGLRDLAILLGGALAGTKIPKP
jgi:hypothetical protein